MKLCTKRTEKRSESTRKLGNSGTESARKPVERRQKIESRVVRYQNRTAMPSVGMRRSTRVFGVVKSVDGARLRSGRRLWPDSGEPKSRRTTDGGDWVRPAKNKKGSGNEPNALKCKQNGWAHDVKVRQQVVDLDEDSRTQLPKRPKIEDLAGGNSVDKMFGIVYSRKRKRSEVRNFDFLGNSECGKGYGDKRYGLQFIRRLPKKKKKNDAESLVGLTGRNVSVRSVSYRALVAIIEPSCRSCWSAFFLNSVLRYLRISRVRRLELTAFLFSQPIHGVFSSHGIRFLRESTINSTGICKIFGASQFIPLFSVDFSAVPACFVSVHLQMFLRIKFLAFGLVNKSVDIEADDDELNDLNEEDSVVLSDRGVSDNNTAVSELNNSWDGAVLHPSVRASKLTVRNTSCRNGVNSRSIQKRRSSLRRRRPRNPSLVGAHKANGALVSDLISSRKNGVPFSSVVSKNKVRRSVRRTAAVTFKEVSSTLVRLTPDVDSSSCSANILVIESDKCHREEGASVMLDFSASGEWLLVVKKDGITRYTINAQKIMRPCSCNRFTHAIVWTEDDNWKLEFPNRQDWFTFKDLYKECSDRNVPALAAKVIPVPVVREVLCCEHGNSAPFCRPNSYITSNGDEVSRALARRTANYDMDSEDEEWLKKLNNEFFTENEFHEHVTVENFELMIDAFEKAFYCSPDDYSDTKAATNLCLDLGKKEVVEAVYGYWMRKRKQKRTALLRVFQSHQPKKAPLIPKPVLRKRRSLKRQPSQSRRGKQPHFFQVRTPEQGAWDEQNAMLKAEEAKASANRSVESAVQKRKMAQLLMDNADLATYKAAMALRIAEAARVAESPDATAGHFLDW